MTKPYSPSEAKAAGVAGIPDEVLESVNTLLARGQGGHTVVDQQELVQLIESKGIDADTLLKNLWLDFEDAYRAQGWTVTYDKPGFNESYNPHWVFDPKNFTR